MSKELQILNNNEFGEIRTAHEGSITLFCGADVARALGYKSPKDAISAHCKGAVKRRTPTSSGKQDMLFIPQGDVFRLAARSALPGADRFERWIFDDVLPTIRRTGSYRAPKTPPLSSVNNAIRMLLPVMEASGMKPAYRLSVMAKLYAPVGLDIPLIGLPAAEPFLDTRQSGRGGLASSQRTESRTLRQSEPLSGSSTSRRTKRKPCR